MFKFLLQTVDDRIRHDFVFEMEHAIDYQNWRGNEMYVEYASIDNIINNDINIDADEIRDYVPIGTIEFVYTFIDKYIKENGSKEIKPINVPEELFPFAKRQIENVYLNEDIRQLLYDRIETEKNALFIKSNDKIKSNFNGFYNKLPIIFRFNEDIKNNKKYKLNIYSDYYLYNVKPDVHIIPLTDDELNNKLREQCESVAKTAANNFLKKSKKQVTTLSLSITDI